ncbi:MAG: thermonuclease family protein [Acidimicrobiales bacterium]
MPENAQVATVVDALDADTVRVALGQATNVVSVIGVARPAPGTCQVAEADAFARLELPAGATVYLVADAQDAEADGALLRYLWDGEGELYNDKLLRQGFATVASPPPNQRFQEQLAGAEAEARATGRGVWACPRPSTARPTTTVPRPATTTPTTTRPTPAATAPPTSAPVVTTTVAAGRTVAINEAFSVTVGETVSVRGQGLTVTFTAAGQDSRCRPGWQCIVAGDATITVTAAKAGTPPGALTLNTDAPKSARYGTHSVELVRLTFGGVATLRVT